jgi:hypothetical protein
LADHSVYLPSPSGTPGFSADPAAPHLRRLNLTTRIEQLPTGAQALELGGVADQRAAVEAVLTRRLEHRRFSRLTLPHVVSGAAGGDAVQFSVSRDCHR